VGGRVLRTVHLDGIGLENYRYIGAGWTLHIVWDILHHLYGQSILPFIPLSSAGCAICDAGIAAWYFMGAPTIAARCIEIVRRRASNRPRAPAQRVWPFRGHSLPLRGPGRDRSRS
jgi:hypothetical protein